MELVHLPSAPPPEAAAAPPPPEISVELVALSEPPPTAVAPSAVTPPLESTNVWLYLLLGALGLLLAQLAGWICAFAGDCRLTLLATA